jgi:hypothetical protein
MQARPNIIHCRHAVRKSISTQGAIATVSLHPFPVQPSGPTLQGDGRRPVKLHFLCRASRGQQPNRYLGTLFRYLPPIGWSDIYFAPRLLILGVKLLDHR